MDRDQRTNRRETKIENSGRFSDFREAYAELFGSIDDIFVSGMPVVSMDQYFESMMFAVSQAVPLMAPENMGIYLGNVAMHLSKFVGDERYINGKGENPSKEEWGTMARRFALHMRRIMAIKDEAYNGDLYCVSNVIHSDLVSTYARRIAVEVGMTQEEADTIEIAGTLHDIGKIGIPDNVITKHGLLTPQERERILPHPKQGARIIRTAGFSHLSDIVITHHIRYDGSGYPECAVNEHYPRDAIHCILPIADAFDAASRDRPYKKGLGPGGAMDELRKNMGTQFHPLLVGVALSKGFLVEEYERKIA